jgi:hypothetical protein
VLANGLVVAGGTAGAVALDWRPTGSSLRGEELERDLESPLARGTAPLGLEPAAEGAPGPRPRAV